MVRPTTTTQEPPQGIEVRGPPPPRGEEVLTPAALAFVAPLHRSFDNERRDLLAQRRARQHEADAGNLPGFLPQTASIREDAGWSVAPIPEGLLDRRVEITGPLERKMPINAVNSGARVFMADFQDTAQRLGAARDAPCLAAAADLLRRVAFDEDFPEFLTIAAYDILTKETRK